MTGRLLAAVAALALLLAACASTEAQVSSPPPEELGFIPEVADARPDSGAGVSIATDADGNPHLAYLALEPELPPGEQPEIDVTAPKVPAVVHAHLVDGVWTRTGVAEEVPVTAEDETAIAVDADGVDHVAWTQGGQVLYSNDAGGGFSEPETASRGSLGGVSVAVGEDGAAWIAFYEGSSGAEGPAALVRVAHREGERWVVETAAEAEPDEPATTGIAVGDVALVAYGSAGQTLVAARLGVQPGDIADVGPSQWESEVADADGGIGVSMAVDDGGFPHVAYYTLAGEVRASVSSGLTTGGAAQPRWGITTVGSVDGAPEPTWSTSVAVADDGGSFVAWQDASRIASASASDGDSQPVEASSTKGGERPRLATGASGDVFLAWHDVEDMRLMLSVRTEEAPLLAAPPAETAAPPAPPTMATGGPPPCEPSGTELAITASPGAAANGYDSDCLAAPADQAFTIDFTNNDTGVPHNVEIITQGPANNPDAQPLFSPEGNATITGPDEATYEVGGLDAGSYFFFCFVHPTTMTGTFVVQ